MSTTLPTIYLNDYTPCPFQVSHVHLHVDLHDEQTTVTTVLHIARNPKAVDAKAPLRLNGRELTLLSVALDGRVLAAHEYAVDEHFLTITSVPEQFVLETQVTIKPQNNTRLSGLYKSRHNYCTQCEAEGFRHITYYFDRPDVLSRFTTTITADKKQYPYLLSNGNLIEKRDLDQGRHWVRWEDPSLKSCYLFALVAGDFDLLEDHFTTMSGRLVKLELFVEKGFVHQAHYAMASLKRAMLWDETRWGREYDLDIYMIVAVSDFNMGAMENKGLNIFNTKYVLAQPETATDQDYTAIEGVIGHEYFHNWSGNRITCRDWFQITLKEGLTVFRDQEFTADMTSAAVERLDTISVVRNRQFPEDAGPLAHPIRPDSYIEINNFYTATVYRKGAEVIRMVQTLITPELFRAGLDLYFARYDGQAVTTDDFLACMAEVSQHDLTQFKRWYSQAGTPVLDVTSDYDANTQTFALTVKQSCPATPGQPTKEPFYLPLIVGLHNGDEQTLIISKPEETFYFQNIPQKPVPSLLRNFSAPVKLHYAYTDAELALLVLHDTDAFARWNAGQELAVRIILRLSDDVAAGKALTAPSMLIKAYASLLDQECDDLSFLTELLALPAESYLHQQVASVNVHAIFEARQFCLQSLATQLHDQWLRVYQTYHDASQPYVYDTHHVGVRSIKNRSLYYLAHSKAPEAVARAFEQFNEANNMTDRLAALIALNNIACPEREQALALFYYRFKNDPLVVNKWLSIQAASLLPTTYDRVVELMQHKAFDINNPNNVYALLGGFGANASQFHDVSGRGYRLMADQVLYLNSKNPQVAARVIEPLTHWQQFQEPYGNLMRLELSRIGENPALSSDIYEIVMKSLIK